MIEHLHIKNFLAFPELVVPELKLINLVAGKNTVGKSSLLQAIRFLYDDDKELTVTKILEARKVGFGGLVNRQNSTSLLDVASQINEYVIGLKTAERYQVLHIEGKDVLPYEPKHFQPIYAHYISPNQSYDFLASLWGDVALTSEEIEVISIVNKTMSLSIHRLSIANLEIKVLLEDNQHPVRIETLGDGVKRVFLYALQIVKSKNGILLIDEIETHLHHSVIRKLWKIIFEYAIKWNIQVVATTHSQDAIRELFYEAAANEEYQGVSQVLRLQIGRNGKHEVIQYPYERLEFVMDEKMEIRGY